MVYTVNIQNIESRTKNGKTFRVAVFNPINIGGYLISRCATYSIGVGEEVSLVMLGGVIPMIYRKK